MEYVIEKMSYFNEKGIEVTVNFVIKYRTSFLGIFFYWKYIKHLGFNGMNKTTFTTDTEAVKFAQHLCCGGTYSKYVSTVLGTVKG